MLVPRSMFWSSRCLLVSSFRSTPGLVARRWHSRAGKPVDYGNYFGTPKDFATLEALNNTTAVTKDAKKYARLASELGPLSPRAEQLFSRILSGEVIAATHLRQITAASVMDVDILETVRVCLGATWRRLKQNPRRVRPALLRKHNKDLARTVLLNIWTSEELSSKLARLDYEASFALCFFAIVEGLETHIMSWILHGVVHDNNVHWRNNLFRQLVAAELVLSTTNKADDALQTLFDMSSAKRAEFERLRRISTPDGFALARDSSPVIRLSLLASSITLHAQLTSGDYSKTDADLYNRFVKYYMGSVSLMQRSDAPFALAALEAYRPLDPNPNLAVARLREICDAGTLADPEQMQLRIPRSQQGVEKFLAHLESLTKRQGKQEDLMWLRQVTPKILRLKKPKKDPGYWPSSSKYRRSPSP